MSNEPTPSPLEYVQSEVSSLLTTRLLLDEAPPALEVEWIKWDSAFRRTDLRPGDRIVAVNGAPIATAETLEEIKKSSYALVGQYGEGSQWEKASAKEGQALALTVRRRAEGTGWRTLEIRGALRATRVYVNAAGRRIMGTGGPDQFETEGTSDSWLGWYDNQFVPALTKAFLECWTLTSYNNRYELEQHLAQKERVDLLVQRYPGPFATAVQADFEAARVWLEGPVRQIPEGALEYRRADDDRVQAIAALGKKAWDGALAAHAGETIEAFPAVDPIHGDRASVTGKCVVLPPIENRDWVPEAGHNYLAKSGNNDDWYIVDAESDAAFRMLRAAIRYEQLVSPDLSASHAILGRILPDPRLLVVQGRGVFGLQVEPLASFTGEKMFVDLTRVQGGESLFAGEEELSRPRVAIPPDDASPVAIVEAMIAALKAGDMTVWRSLFADWDLFFTDAGRPRLYRGYSQLSDSDFEASRRLLLSSIYAVNVVWVGDPRALSTGKEYEGAPRVDEVEVEIEHLGLFDGVYRPFSDTSVYRWWKLQRLDGGPFRIASWQSI